KWSGGGMERITKCSRSATPPPAPQTEAGVHLPVPANAARDERARSEAERAQSRGGEGRPAARGAGAESALVTAGSVELFRRCRGPDSGSGFANGYNGRRH